jgi:hypothetical protein
MRNKIERRKNWILSRKIKKQYGGLWKVASDAGYGDGSTIGNYLNIVDALKVYHEAQTYGSSKFSLSDYLYKDRRNKWEINYSVFDTSSYYYIVQNNHVLVWEHPDFDPGDI